MRTETFKIESAANFFSSLIKPPAFKVSCGMEAYIYSFRVWRYVK